jgi:hypothetical protein
MLHVTQSIFAFGPVRKKTQPNVRCLVENVIGMKGGLRAHVYWDYLQILYVSTPQSKNNTNTKRDEMKI